MKQSWVLWAARCIVVLALGAGWCSANELQYGTIHFERSEGNAVRFFINMQWRRTDAFGGSSDDDHKAKTGDLVEVMGAPGAKSGPLHALLAADMSSSALRCCRNKNLASVFVL